MFERHKSNILNTEFVDFYKNISWGVLTSVIQNILYSIFFIVVARKYVTNDFANYIIANNLYGFVLSFSSLGLGQWFLREVQNTYSKYNLYKKYLKIQVVIGFVFYLINLVMCYIIYNNNTIILLSIILGLNIIIENIISVFKFINIDGDSQYKTFVYISIEAILKFLLAIVLLKYKLGIILLCTIIVSIKLFSVFLFFKYGVFCKLYFKEIVDIKLKFSEIYGLIVKNFSFAIIGSISVLFWSIGNIIVTKFLTIDDIANYDIILKIFVMAQIIPVIFSSTIFPKLVVSAKNDISNLNTLVRNYYPMYLIYGLISYVFVYSYADLFIPLLFGSKYSMAAGHSKEMFLTIIIFPIVLFQANILIALKKEKIDMWMNLIVLIINFSICLLGVLYIHNLSIINYSIFMSFLLFMLMQDIYLLKLKFQETYFVIKKYMTLICYGIVLYLATLGMKNIWIFPLYLIIIGTTVLLIQINKILKYQFSLIRNKIIDPVDHKEAKY